MRIWMIVGLTIVVGATNASAQSIMPPAISSTPNLGCQARTGGLVVPKPGETTGSANLSDELSRSNGAASRNTYIAQGVRKRWILRMGPNALRTHRQAF